MIIRTISWFCLLTAGALAAGAAIGWQVNHTTSDFQKKHVRKIPLESIFTTSKQEGLLEPPDLEPFYRGTCILGASNIFLVRAGSIKQALEGTRRVLAGGGSATRVPSSSQIEFHPSAVWLVAYFGVTGSNPKAWLVVSVELHDKTIRVNFSEPVRQFRTEDTLSYTAWAPLGELRPGTYTLELFDVGKKEVVLMRRAEVVGP
jgi:hypothetical protein